MSTPTKKRKRSESDASESDASESLMDRLREHMHGGAGAGGGFVPTPPPVARSMKNRVLYPSPTQLEYSSIYPALLAEGSNTPITNHAGLVRGGMLSPYGSRMSESQLHKIKEIVRDGQRLVDSEQVARAQEQFMQLMGYPALSFNRVVQQLMNDATDWWFPHPYGYEMEKSALNALPAFLKAKYEVSFGNRMRMNYHDDFKFARDDVGFILQKGSGVYARMAIEQGTKLCPHALYIHVDRERTEEKYVDADDEEHEVERVRITVYDPNYHKNSRVYRYSRGLQTIGDVGVGLTAELFDERNAAEGLVNVVMSRKTGLKVRSFRMVPKSGEIGLFSTPTKVLDEPHQSIGGGLEGVGICWYLSHAYKWLHDSVGPVTARDIILASKGGAVFQFCLKHPEFHRRIEEIGGLR